MRLGPLHERQIHDAIFVLIKTPSSKCVSLNVYLYSSAEDPHLYKVHMRMFSFSA